MQTCYLVSYTKNIGLSTDATNIEKNIFLSEKIFLNLVGPQGPIS